MTSKEADELLLEFARRMNVRRVLVIGSQAVHATHPDPPIDVVARSPEIDLVPSMTPAEFEKWYFYAHEHMGSDSDMEIERGVYIDMVNPSVPKLPSGWETRALERTLELGDGDRLVAVYPEIHDLIVTKLLANRPQDEAFLRGVMKLQPISATILRERVRSVPLASSKEALRKWAIACVNRAFP